MLFNSLFAYKKFKNIFKNKTIFLLIFMSFGKKFTHVLELTYTTSYVYPHKWSITAYVPLQFIWLAFYNFSYCINNPNAILSIKLIIL